MKRGNQADLGVVDSADGDAGLAGGEEVGVHAAALCALGDLEGVGGGDVVGACAPGGVGVDEGAGLADLAVGEVVAFLADVAEDVVVVVVVAGLAGVGADEALAPGGLDAGGADLAGLAVGAAEAVLGTQAAPDALVGHVARSSGGWRYYFSWQVRHVEASEHARQLATEHCTHCDPAR